MRPARPLDWIELGFGVALNRSPATRSLYLDWIAPGVDLLRALCADAERRPRVAETRGRLVGFVGLDAHPDRGPDGIAGERTAIRLLGPVVRRGFRRQGIGGMLLREARAAGTAHYGGDRPVLAVVGDGNRAAQRLLTGHGLLPGGREHCMIMTAPLAADAGTTDAGRSGLRLRSGREPADVARIYPIYRSAWPGFKTRASFAADVRHPPGALWWLERDGGAGAEVIAFLQHVARPDGHDHIEYVAVHERLRGRGYGRHFLELALAALWRDPRLRSLRLSTAEENQPPRTSALDKHLRFRY